MHLLAVLEYDGTDFVGFQSQAKGRTVQDELERTLAEFGNKPVRITGGGRTDTGVHATGQTATFTIDWTGDPDTLVRAINAKLPNDVAVKSLREVSEKFSARKNAQSRTYRYRIYNHRVRAPLMERYALRVAQPLDVDAMRAAAELLRGVHDFGAFGTPPQGSTTTVREIKRAEVQREGAMVTIEFEANAFLYRMVRRLVGTLLQVGRGEMSVEEFAQVLARKQRASNAVPPHGLCLTEIKYNSEF